MDNYKQPGRGSSYIRLEAAVIILVVVTIIAMVITRQSIFSPGPLNAQSAQAQVGGVNIHADLSGQCAACHAPPWSSDGMAQRCLKCHTDVAAELQNPNTLHGSSLPAGSALTCTAGCHTEHRGAAAPLTTFDHSLTTFPLTGKHITTACAECHVNGILKGTPTTCYACHQKDDTHQGLYGQDCSPCHNTTSWPQATIDHSKTAFALTGAHVTTACASCHINGVYQGTPSTCYACHQKDDRHNGSKGQDCARCHNTTSWNRR